jgi:hypothetical protein
MLDECLQAHRNRNWPHSVESQAEKDLLPYLHLIGFFILKGRPMSKDPVGIGGTSDKNIVVSGRFHCAAIIRERRRNDIVYSWRKSAKLLWRLFINI